MSRVKITKDFVAAIKRNDRRSMLVATLAALGYENESKQIADAGRVTVALIDRVVTPMTHEDYVSPDADTKPEKTDTDDREKTVYEKTDDPTLSMFYKMEEAIVNGKWKKAKKLHKKLVKSGLQGSEMDKYGKAIKKGLKNG